MSATMVAVYVYGIYQENATMVAHICPDIYGIYQENATMVAHICPAHKLIFEDLQLKAATMVAVYVYGIYYKNATMVAHNCPAHKKNCNRGPI